LRTWAEQPGRFSLTSQLIPTVLFPQLFAPELLPQLLFWPVIRVIPVIPGSYSIVLFLVGIVKAS